MYHLNGLMIQLWVMPISLPRTSFLLLPCPGHSRTRLAQQRLRRDRLIRLLFLPFPYLPWRGPALPWSYLPWTCPGKPSRHFLSSPALPLSAFGLPGSTLSPTTLPWHCSEPSWPRPCPSCLDPDSAPWPTLALSLVNYVAVSALSCSVPGPFVVLPIPVQFCWTGIGLTPSFPSMHRILPWICNKMPSPCLALSCSVLALAGSVLPRTCPALTLPRSWIN